MFKSLKNKLNTWVKNISKESLKETKQKKVPKEKTERKKERKEKISEKKKFVEKIIKRTDKIEISEKNFEIYSEELKILLLENNVAFEVAEKIINELKEKIIGKEFLKKEIEKEIKEFLKEIIKNIFVEPIDILEKIKEKNKENLPYIILFLGINGTGKTTTIAKFANFLKKEKISCVFAAADTFRAASIEQIKKHGEILNVKIISKEYGSDPASVGFDAINYAKKNNINCVLIDTAGRMHTSKNLIKEIEKISRVCMPDSKIFVGESITGNDIIEQIKIFDSAIKIDGIILTKADIDEKGGTALSVNQIIKKPILFIGTGQEYEKIEIFDKKKFIKKLEFE